MTAQNLYNNLKQGKITQSHFLKEIRQQSHLPITKFNSFEDTIKILKNKSLISEEMGKYKTDKNVFFPKQEIKTIDQVSPHEYNKGLNYELDLFDKSAGQNPPTNDELKKAQQKVLKNLSNDEYYYTRKIMTDGQKKQENQDLDYTELGKETKAKNQMIKGKILKENSDYIDPEELGFDLEDFDLLDDGSLLDPETNKKVFNASTGAYDKRYLEKYLASKQELDEDLNIDLNQPEECESCNRDKPELDIDVMDPSELERLSRIIEEWGLTEYDLEDSDVIEELADEFLRRGEEGDLEEGIALKDKAGNISYVKDDAEANQKMNDARAKGIQLTKQNV
jgi:hypothetical protein